MQQKRTMQCNALQCNPSGWATPLHPFLSFPLPPQSLSVWAENQKRATNNPKFSVNFVQNNALSWLHSQQRQQAASANHHVTTRPPPGPLPSASSSSSSPLPALALARRGTHLLWLVLVWGGGDSARPALITCSGTRPVYPVCVCVCACACMSVHASACVCTRVRTPKATAAPAPLAALAAGVGLSLVNSRFCLSLSRRIAQRRPRWPFDKRRRNKTMPNEKPSHEVQHQLHPPSSSPIPPSAVGTGTGCCSAAPRGDNVTTCSVHWIIWPSCPEASPLTDSLGPAKARQGEGQARTRTRRVQS